VVRVECCLLNNSEKVLVFYAQLNSDNKIVAQNPPLFPHENILALSGRSVRDVSSDNIKSFFVTSFIFDYSYFELNYLLIYQMLLVCCRLNKLFERSGYCLKNQNLNNKLDW
jgi:hypothetical protein